MRSHLLLSALTIALSLTIPITASTGQPIATPTATQQQMSEIDKAIAEGMRLFKEESAESLKKAIAQFEKTLELARSAQAKDKQALSLLLLGRINDILGKKQKALEYYNQSLPLYDTLGDLGGKATTLNNIGRIYSAFGEKQKALEYYNQALLSWQGNRILFGIGCN
jgi:tetratricopeptide (TPR) repeat protein